MDYMERLQELWQIRGVGRDEVMDGITSHW